MVHVLRQNAEALDNALAAGAEQAFAFLEQLVAEASVLGHEAGAQAVLADELGALGFELEWVPIPADLADLPYAGGPPLTADQRASRRGSERGSGSLDERSVHADPP